MQIASKRHAAAPRSLRDMRLSNATLDVLSLGVERGDAGIDWEDVTSAGGSGGTISVLINHRLLVPLITRAGERRWRASERAAEMLKDVNAPADCDGGRMPPPVLRLVRQAGRGQQGQRLLSSPWLGLRDGIYWLRQPDASPVQVSVEAVSTSLAVRFGSEPDVVPLVELHVDAVLELVHEDWADLAARERAVLLSRLHLPECARSLQLLRAGQLPSAGTVLHLVAGQWRSKVPAADALRNAEAVITEQCVALAARLWRAPSWQIGDIA